MHVAPTDSTAVVAHPVAQRRVGTGEQVDQPVGVIAEACEPVLTGFQALDRGPVLLQEAEHLAASQHDPYVAIQDLPPVELLQKIEFECNPQTAI